jgi:hypothetical protein
MQCSTLINITVIKSIFVVYLLVLRFKKYVWKQKLATM